ncbi:MAG: mechanosensitive ion channel family protein [Rhodobiaceae bacterium]|nr:mechanosensitive ion channel family protein [Rhodobiaceae bacterium]MCC0056887.1 mechanosensitive ion channel family protein [Rhodobiaceae bacterium]
MKWPGILRGAILSLILTVAAGMLPALAQGTQPVPGTPTAADSGSVAQQPAPSSSTPPSAAPAAASPATDQSPAATAEPQASTPAQRQTPSPAALTLEPGAAAQVDSWKLTLDQIEIGLSRDGINEQQLSALEQEIQPIHFAALEMANRLNDRLQTLRARLQEVAPAPKEPESGNSGATNPGTAETPAVSGEAATLTETVAQLEAVAGKARLVVVQAEQLQSRISELRRAAFTGSLTAKQPSLFAPSLWQEAYAALPRSWRSARIIAGDALAAASVPTLSTLLPAIAALVGGLLAVILSRVFLRRFTRRSSLEDEPTRFARINTAAWRVVVYGVIPALAIHTIGTAFLAGGHVPPRLEPFVRTVLVGISMLVFIDALARTILSPRAAAWRLVDLPDTVTRPTEFTVDLAVLLVIVRYLLMRLFDLTATPLALSVATSAVFSLLIVIVLALGLMHIAQARSAVEESHIMTRNERYWRLLRGVLWLSLAVIAAAAISGYVALAAFLSTQLVFAGVLLALLALIITLIDELTDAYLDTDDHQRTALARAIGVERASAKQIAILASGLVRFALIVLAGILLLLPWGFDTRQWRGWVDQVFFGFKVGDITISLSAILTALLLFLIGFAGTRAFQHWLSNSYMPHTKLDIGLRNSIGTALGYVGVVLSAAFAITYIGLDLANLAIVAGALSVGIGFGLQSVVNNFVSGLILLAERPIKEGDWIKVGSAEGNVQRISIRATELTTFDRATVIVPNSDLISGTVTNMMHDNRIGRLVLQYGVGYNSDPDKVRDILLSAAQAHPDVMQQPEPFVVFMELGDSSLNFALYTYLRDVAKTLLTRSDLNFTIFRALKDAGIEIPFPQRDLNIRTSDGLEKILAGFAPQKEKSGKS